MKISKTHQRLANRLNDQTALKYPERFLGPNWKNVLNFWIYLDTLSVEDFGIFVDCYYALDIDARISARDNAFKAAKDTIGRYYADAACGAAPRIASGYATRELIASHNLESLNLLPLFLNL
jgi:hypothetical protein